MAPRYLFGPVSPSFADQFLARPRSCGDCLAFDLKPGNDLTIAPGDSWDEVCGRLPENWRPDFIALFLHYGMVPACLENAPVPLVGLAGDANLLWHYYRRRLPRCDLVLTDTASAEALAREGLTSVRVANLFGAGRAYFETLLAKQPRDIDVLFVGNFQGAVQRERLAWIGRLANLANRWRVHITTNVHGDAYRALCARARIVFNRSIRGECNARAVEATVSGALLFQEAGNREVPDFFAEGKEYVAYDADHLESQLEHFLEHEDQLRAIADAGQLRAQHYGFADFWQKAVDGFAPELPAHIARTGQLRTSEETLLLRSWQAAQTIPGADALLVADLQKALGARPASAVLQHALAAALAHGAGKNDVNRQAVIQALRTVLQLDPTHVMASLNLAEVLMEAGQKGPACEQARLTLGLLDRCPCLSRDVLDAVHVPVVFDYFRVEWERAAWMHAGQPEQEEKAKRALVRWRLHSILAMLTGEIADYFAAAAARPDLPATQAALGCALARANRFQEAISHLRQAVRDDPFDVPAAAALYEALGNVAAWPEQHRLAEHQGRLHLAAPGLVPARDWFKAPVAIKTATTPRAEQGEPAGSLAAEVVHGLGPIVWQGDVESLHSLALVNRALCLGLIERGCTLAVRSGGSPGPTATQLPLSAGLAEARERQLDQPPAVHIRHQWPPDWTPPPPGEGHWVVIQPWEFGSVPRIWIDALKSQVDEMWTYSSYVRACYIKSGLPAERVHVVPLGVDNALFEKQHAAFPLRTQKRFKFLFVGGTIHRKGIDVLLRAYAAAFTGGDDVCLVIKDAGNGSFYRGQTAEKLIADVQTDSGPEVEHLTQDLSAEEMASLYQTCDCLVQPYRGEGFGLPVAEAMACGLPVIITGHGAALDFCDESRAFLLPAKIGLFSVKRIDDLETVDTPWLAEPDPAMLRYYLRYVVEHPEKARRKGQAAAAYVRRHVTWDRSVDCVLARLAALHGKPVRRQSALPAHAANGSQHPRRPRVSLAMIVRNEEANLEACLRSVADLVDEMIVVDTGSTDNTKEVARRCGAKVFDFAWVDDFAAARNESLRHATGQWIFWLDADEHLDDINRQRLARVLAGLRDENVGYFMRQYSLLEGSKHAAAQVNHLRLFPRRPDAWWRGRVHEQILVGLRSVGCDVRDTDVVINHRGYHDPSRQAGKVARNLRLLQLAFADDPRDAFTLYNLGAVHLTQGHLEESLDYLQRSLSLLQPHDATVAKVHSLMTRIHQQRGNPQEALVVCRAGRALFPHEGELLFHEAVILHEQKKMAGAEACLLELLRMLPGKSLNSSDAGLYGYRSRNFLAQIYEDQGRLQEAEAQWQAAVAECRAFTPGWLSLSRLYVNQHRWKEAEQVVPELLQDPRLAPAAAVLRGRVHLGRRQFVEACQCFRQAIAMVPQDVLPRVLLSDALLQEGADWHAAEQALRDVLALDPGHTQARNNLRLHLASQGKPANGAAAPAKGPQRVSLCMIVRNEEHNLGACLASVADLVDEIIVVDTGSTDATKAIALRYGAKVFDFPWIDHFAAARNESLKHATGQWIFWLDADDRLDEEARAKLRHLFANLKDENVGYLMKCVCLPDSSGLATEVDHLRLFRNRPDNRWEFRIHEQIWPAVKRNGGVTRCSSAVIHHTGYQDRELRARKLQRDLRILLIEQAEQPDHPFTLFNLGQVYKELGRTPEALEALTASLRHSLPTDSIVRKLYALIAQCHLTLGNAQEALAVSREGKALFADDLEILYQEGVCLARLSDWEGAAACWQQCLNLPPADHVASINPGLRGHVTHDSLARALRQLGRVEEAEQHWRAALSERPYYESAWRGLMSLWLDQQRWTDLERMAQGLQGGPRGPLNAACVRSRVLLGQRQFAAARDMVQNAMKRFKKEVEPMLLLTHVLLQEGVDWDAAEQALLDVQALVPDHPEAKSNLAVLRRERGRKDAP